MPSVQAPCDPPATLRWHVPVGWSGLQILRRAAFARRCVLRGMWRSDGVPARSGRSARDRVRGSSGVGCLPQRSPRGLERPACVRGLRSTDLPLAGADGRNAEGVRDGGWAPVDSADGGRRAGGGVRRGRCVRRTAAWCRAGSVRQSGSVRQPAPHDGRGGRRVAVTGAHRPGHSGAIRPGADPGRDRLTGADRFVCVERGCRGD